MKQAVIKIAACRWCPFVAMELNPPGCGLKLFNHEPRPILDVYKFEIPEWCPLDDYIKIEEVGPDQNG